MLNLLFCSSCSSQGPTLHDAASAGDVLTVSALIAADGSALRSRRAEDGYTALHAAAQYDNTAVVSALLSAGAEADALSHSRMTPLHVAAVQAPAAVVSALVAAGASLDAAEDGGYTPLHIAALMGNTAAVRALLDLGANVTAADVQGWTPLHVSVSRGRLAAAEVLMRWRAPIESVGARGFTPLHVACQRGQADAVGFLLRAGASTSARADNGWSPLHVVAGSAEEGGSGGGGGGGASVHASVAELLLRNDPRLLAAVDTAGYTPLHTAAAEGNVRVLAQLLRAAAAAAGIADVVNARGGPRGATALHLAVDHPHRAAALESVRLLVGAEAALLTQADGRTPLHLAALDGSLPLAAALLPACAASPSALAAADELGYTPLSLAYRVRGAGRAPLLRLLLWAGGLERAPPHEGWDGLAPPPRGAARCTPPDASVLFEAMLVSRVWGHEDLVRLLEPAAAVAAQSVHTASSVRLQLEARVFAADASPLHQLLQSQPPHAEARVLELAAYRGSVEGVRALLEALPPHGVPPSAWWLALQIASRSGHREAMLALRSAAAARLPVAPASGPLVTIPPPAAEGAAEADEWRWFRRASWDELPAGAERDAAFTRGMEQLGVRCPRAAVRRVRLGEAGLMRGLVATDNIEVGGLVCAMPLRAAISREAVSLSSMAPLLHAYAPTASLLGGLPSSEDAVVALFILREARREASYYMPYARAMLTELQTDVPALWPEASARFQRLSPYAQRLARTRRAALAQAYGSVVPDAILRFSRELSEGAACPADPSQGCSRAELEAAFTFEKLAAAMLARGARNFANAGLLPMVDVMNCAARASDDQLQFEVSFRSNEVLVLARRAFIVGEELQWYYKRGSCREQWVDSHGFAPEDAPPCEGSD